MSRTRWSSLSQTAATAALVVAALLTACGGSAACSTGGDETRVTVDASKLDGVRKICIEDTCSTEGDGVERLLASFTEERPERITFEVTLVEGGGQTIRSGGVQLACDAGGRDITLIPQPDGSDRVIVR